MSGAAAPDLLAQAADEMAARAERYDAPEGERSMAAAVASFNALTGGRMTVTEGWTFMALLKLARAQSQGGRGSAHLDNYVDGAAYMALAGEEAARGRKG